MPELNRSPTMRQSVAPLGIIVTDSPFVEIVYDEPLTVLPLLALIVTTTPVADRFLIVTCSLALYKLADGSD